MASHGAPDRTFQTGQERHSGAPAGVRSSGRRCRCAAIAAGRDRACGPRSVRLLGQRKTRRRACILGWPTPALSRWRRGRRAGVVRRGLPGRAPRRRTVDRTRALRSGLGHRPSPPGRRCRLANGALHGVRTARRRGRFQRQAGADPGARGGGRRALAGGGAPASRRQPCGPRCPARGGARRRWRGADAASCRRRIPERAQRRAAQAQTLARRRGHRGRLRRGQGSAGRNGRGAAGRRCPRAPLPPRQRPR